MAKQLNVNLSFTADTEKAKAQIRELQNALTKITQNASKTSPLGLTEDVNSAIKKVTELQTILQKATTETGSLDLGQFNQELKKANLSAETIKNSLVALGPEGQAAFSKIAQSVSMAEVPLKRTNGLLAEFATTLKNTARWQLSSSILHGFIGSVQSAYRYAQDLNSSLNDIRIVTGQSTEQMAEFAKQANESAKALSATTTAYTDAALIFYQQGLGDEAVKERTDTVIKMSNVTGEAVKDVSSYMTAIWNNFDDGSESLEHYADVITALGAATASSSEEIAGGLEKFASIGKTVGLSYDYATAALATVVSATRQSEDVVGNAFKTIFSRIQGLKLGETLEDDVDLNKYSAALKAVGVEVVTSSGQLRDLDNILDDLASKWDNLTSAQQTALAQTVAGTRQYAQFIALMGNWDSMTKNLEIAQGAEGSLQEQANIYAESWEAARKRVKASAQAIYDDLLNDQFFIQATDSVSKILDGIHNIIEALGGLKGILPLIGTLILRVFGSDISKSINDIIYNFKLMTKNGREEIYKMRTEWISAFKDMIDETTVLGQAQKKVFDSQVSVQEAVLNKTLELESVNLKLSSGDQERLKRILDINKAIGDQYIELSKVKEQQEESNSILRSRLKQQVNTKVGKMASNLTTEELYVAESLQQQFITGTQIINNFEKELENIPNSAQGLDSLIIKVKNLETSFEETGIESIEFKEQLSLLGKSTSIDEFKTRFASLKDIVEEVGIDAQELFDKITITLEQKGIVGVDKLIAEIQQGASTIGEVEHKILGANTNINQNVKETTEEVKKLKGELPGIADQWITIGRTMMSVSMIISSLKGLLDTLTDSNKTFGEKTLAIFSSLGILIPTLITSFNSLKTALGGATAAQWGLNVAMDANPIGVIILGITALIAAIAGAVTLIDKFTMSTKEASEQLESLNQQMENFASEKKSLQGHIDELKELSEEYDRLSEKAGQYDKDIDNLTENERNRYNEIKDTIIQYNDELLGYYNSQNEAILKNNDGIRETIELLKEELKLKQAEIYTGKDAEKKDKAFLQIYKDAYGEKITAEDSLNSIASNLVSYGASPNTISNILTNIVDSDEELTSEGQQALEKLQEIFQLDNQGQYDYNSFFEKRDEIKNLFDTLIKEDISDTDFEQIFNYFDFAISDLENEYNAYAVKLEEAKENLEEKSIIDTHWLMGRIKTDENYNSNYNSLAEEIGEQEADNFILSFAEGLRMGLDEHGNYIGPEDLYEQVIQYEQKLLDLLSGEDNQIRKNIETESQQYTKENFINYEDYYKNTIKQAEEFLAKNPEIEDENIKKAILKNIFGGDFSFDENGELVEFENSITNYFNKLKDKIVENSKEDQDEGLINQLLGEKISPEHFKDFDYIIEHFDEAIKETNNWEEALSLVISDLERAEQIEDYSKKIEISSDVINSLLQSKELTDKQLESLSDLEDAYKELGIIQDKNSKAYLNKMLEIREALEKEQTQLKKNIEQEKIDRLAIIKVTTDGGEERFQKALKDICEADYEVVISVKSDIQSDFDTITTKMEELDELASKIGKDYKVAAEDLEELNNVFPGILANMTLVKDGSVKLDKEVVKSAMEAAKAELAADTDTTIGKLENQATELATRRDTAKTVADIAEKLFKEESTLTEEKGNLEEALATFKTDLSDQITIEQEKDDKDTAESGAEAATSLANSFGKAYEIMAKDAIKWAEIAHQANQYAAGKSEDMPTMATFGGATFETTANVSEVNENRDKADLSSYKDYGEVTDWKSVTDYYNNLADSYDEAYNNTLGKIAEILARNNQSNKTYTDIGAGKGTKTEKSSKQETKDLKKYLDEFDRFYPIKKAIEDVSDALSDLSKKQQHLAGKALANSLKEQNKLLQNQAELYKELLKEQEDYRNELAGTLASFGMTFDAATGNITNYAAATQSALDKYNQAIITYNTSAQDEVAKATLKTAEDEYNVFKNTLSKYQSILKDIESTVNNIDDIFYKQIENNLKAFEVEIKLDLDIEAARRKVLDFIQEINTDFKKVYKTTAEWTKLFDVAAKKVETFTEQEGTLSTDLKELKQIADIIDDPNYNYGSSDALFASKSDAINKYKEITETLMSDSKELYNLYESSWQNYLSAVDEVKDQWNNVIKDFEKINKTLDHYSKLIELLYGGEETVAGRNYLDELYGAQANNSLAKQTALKEEILALQKEYDEILAAGADQNNEDVKRIAEAIEDASDKLNSEIESYLETIQKRLTNSIKSIMDTADKAMTQDVGINKVIERWNDAKEAAEGYYDETERIYELQRMENEWNDLISSTSRIKDQQYLKQIMDSQLENLKEKTHLSEYDVELAEKELEVQKAYIALQDAQNNKNSMKLVRNEQGNWTYQYVADQDDVASKQQDFLKALNDKYKFVKEKSAEMTEKVMNLYQTANEKITALLEEYKTADEVRRAEIEEEYDYLYSYYYGPNGVIVQAAQQCANAQDDTTKTMMQLLEGHYEVNEKNFEEMTSEQQRLIEELKNDGITKFEELSLALGDKENGIYGDIYQHAEEALDAQNTDWQNLAQNIINDWAENPDKNVRDVIRDSYDQIMDKVEEYDGAIKASEEASGVAWGNIKIDIDETTQSLDILIQKTDALSNFRTHIDAIGTAWLNVKSGIESAVSALENYLRLLKEDTGSPTTPDYSTSTVGTGSGYTSSGGNGNNGGSNGDNGNTLKDIKSTKTRWQICELGTSTPYGSYDSYEDAVKACQNEGYFSYASGNICYYNKTNKNTAGASGGGYNYNNNRTKNVMMAYASGGYTGDWNSSEGRIGVLHEKELVLNKEDTSNILNAVNLVRGISNISSLVSSAISSNLAGMALSLTGLGSNTINRNVSTNNSSNNVFNINAEFPNAENVEEIREAILSLPNLAAQYLAQK